MKSSRSATGMAMLLLLSFRKIPRGVEAVKHFDLQKYLGTWYEIARLDYRWEKGLDHVTATYIPNEDGTIRVDNRGYNARKNKWEQSIGKAKPVAGPTEGRLKVSFFGPFYSGYNVIAIDEDYQYALVIGESKNYMWILARKKTIPDSVRQKYVGKAQSLGIRTEALVWVKQD